MTFTIRLYYNAESAAKECSPDQVVAELYDGWFMNVPPGASIETGYPIVRILGKPVKKCALKNPSMQGTTGRVPIGRTPMRSAPTRMLKSALKPRTGPIVPESERSKLIEKFIFHNPTPPAPPRYLIDRTIPEDCDTVFFGG